MNSIQIDSQDHASPEKVKKQSLRIQAFHFKSYFKLLKQSNEAIQLFIIINLLLMVACLEIFKGIYEKNIFFITEAFHGILHISAYFLSLYALIFSKKNCTMNYTYGFIRLETLAAFSNCIFLYFVSTFNLFRNFHGLFEGHSSQEESQSNKNEVLSNNFIQNTNLCKFFISAFGILCFYNYAFYFPLQKLVDKNEIIAESRKYCGSNSLPLSFDDQSKDQNQIKALVNHFEQYGRTAMNYFKNKTLQFYEIHRLSSHFENLHTVFLHFFIESFVKVFNILFQFLDPESYINQLQPQLILSVIILITTILITKSIIKTTGRIILQAFPIKDEQSLNQLVDQLTYIPGVLEIQNQNFWGLSSGYLVCSIKIIISKSSDYQKVMEQSYELLEKKFSSICIELEKDY